MKLSKTKFKDKNGHYICIGDIVYVDQYPGKYVGGALEFEGVVEKDADGRVVVVYYDIGEVESFPLSIFPRTGRVIYNEQERYKYWKTAFLGGEPPEELYKREESK